MSAPKVPAPGSWTLAPDSSNGFVFVEGVAQPMRCGSGRRARFAAAAPELYAALDDLLRETDGGQLPCGAEFSDRARAALAKAVQP